MLNENGTCSNLELAEMRVITVISISPIWNSIQSYHLGNNVWLMRCVVLSEHLPKIHISFHTPVWIVPYQVFTNHLKECVFTPLAFQAEGVLWLLVSVRMSRLSGCPSVRSVCLSVWLSICPWTFGFQLDLQGHLAILIKNSWKQHSSCSWSQTDLARRRGVTRPRPTCSCFHTETVKTSTGLGWQYMCVKM